MQGLQTLYEHHVGRSSIWHRLVETVVPAFIDPTTDGPQSGRERNWPLIAGYRIRMARERDELALAERLAASMIRYRREVAEKALSKPFDQLSDDESTDIRNLASILAELAQIHQVRDDEACLSGFRESSDLFRRLGNKRMAAAAASSIADTYRDLEEVQDFDQARQWYETVSRLEDPSDHLNRTKLTASIAILAYRQALVSKVAQRPGQEIAALLLESERRLERGLVDIHSTAASLRPLLRRLRAQTLSALGDHLQDSRHFETALAVIRLALREARGDVMETGLIRETAVEIYMNVDRLDLAAHYPPPPPRTSATSDRGQMETWHE